MHSLKHNDPDEDACIYEDIFYVGYPSSYPVVDLICVASPVPAPPRVLLIPCSPLVSSVSLLGIPGIPISPAPPPITTTALEEDDE